MMTIELSTRERWGLKWHLNSVRCDDRTASRNLDAIWIALKLDDITMPNNADPVSIVNDDLKPYEMESSHRDALIDFIAQPKLGVMSRILGRADVALIKSSRDG